MNSTILTKVNTVTPRNFGEQCEWTQGQSEFGFLTSFVYLCHKTADLIKNTEHNYIDVFTSKGSYRYTGYKNHIVRTDLVRHVKLKFYKIS